MFITNYEHRFYFIYYYFDILHCKGSLILALKAKPHDINILSESLMAHYPS